MADALPATDYSATDEPAFARHDIVAPETGRLDRALAQALPDMSRSRLQALIRDGQVRVAGEVVTEPSRKVAAGESLTILIPPPAPAEPLPEAIALAIVYEDDDLIVIDKPAGLVVHPAPGHEGGTLVNALIAHCGASLSGIGGVRRPGIVHRLDKDTSGLLVVAKNDRAHQALSAQFADHGRSGPLERAYLALAWGQLPARTMRIEAAIERSRANREKMAVVPPKAPEARGRHAITHVEVLETFPSGTDEPVAALVRCRLETGRTHQIRVHLASMGHPLLGDALYGKGFRTKAARLPPGAAQALEALDRQALHAAVLGFAHPRTGEHLRFESAPPADLAGLINALRHAG